MSIPPMSTGPAITRLPSRMICRRRSSMPIPSGTTAPIGRSRACRWAATAPFGSRCRSPSATPRQPPCHLPSGRTCRPKPWGKSSKDLDLIRSTGYFKASDPATVTVGIDLPPDGKQFRVRVRHAVRSAPLQRRQRLHAPATGHRHQEGPAGALHHGRRRRQPQTLARRFRVFRDDADEWARSRVPG